MPFAILELSDYGIILLIVALAGGSVATMARRPSDFGRLDRIEKKLDLILTHLGLSYTPPPKSRWQELAADPSQKIMAIKLYREEHGVGLAEAKKAVEDYMQNG